MGELAASPTFSGDLEVVTLNFEPLVTESLPKQIAERIRRLIVGGELAIDERLPTEYRLSERFGVSRPTVREALKRLAAQNLVRSRRGPAGGTFVTRPGLEDARDNLINVATLLVSTGVFDFDQVSDARLALECLCADMAAGNVPREIEAGMEEALHKQSNPNIGDREFCASDVAFHRAMADAAGNAFLGFLMGSVIEALQPVANMIAFTHCERSRIVDQHWRLLGALRGGNGVMAQAILEEQAKYMKGRYAAVLADR